MAAMEKTPSAKAKAASRFLLKIFLRSGRAKGSIQSAEAMRASGAKYSTCRRERNVRRRKAKAPNENDRAARRSAFFANGQTTIAIAMSEKSEGRPVNRS